MCVRLRQSTTPPTVSVAMAVAAVRRRMGPRGSWTVQAVGRSGHSEALSWRVLGNVSTTEYLKLTAAGLKQDDDDDKEFDDPGKFEDETGCSGVPRERGAAGGGVRS
jgi:hypothetical protein